jgi:hypothetical protein
MKKKTEVMSIGEFLHSNQAPTTREAIKRHLDKYGIVYKIVGTTVVLFISGGALETAFASGGIEAGAEKLYTKLLSVGKWVLIFKGGFDTIKNMASGDMDSAKKGFIGYLLVYLLLLGLPWAMDEIDGIYKEMNV